MAQQKPDHYCKNKDVRSADNINNHELKLVAAEFLDLWQVNLTAWSTDPELPARLEDYIKSLAATRPSGEPLS